MRKKFHRHSDTSDTYEFGGSVELLGEFLQGRRDHFVLATKFTNDISPKALILATSNSRKTMVGAVEANLRRLRTGPTGCYVFARQQDLDKGVEDLFGCHGVKRAKLARDQRAQVRAQLRSLPTAVHTLEALLRLRPVFLSALETRVAGLG